MITTCIDVILLVSWIVVSQPSVVDTLRSYDVGFIDRDTGNGKVRGLLRMVHGARGVESYLGVPYARPPIGKLRYEAPLPPEPWGDTMRLAITLPPACPQAIEGIDYIEYHVPGFNLSSEDCLYLNIYTPQHSRSLLPVALFIHGGSYQNGMGAMFDGTMLSLEGVVVVTINYRLGPLGFLSAADRVLPGNYGMLDQVAALKWVQANIRYFNGDPSHVTIIGHSAGGCSVGLHQLSPLSKGLFSRVIQQSGSPLANWAVNRYRKTPDFFFNLFVSTVGCTHNTTSDIKACLQSLPSHKLEAVIRGEFEWTPSLVPQYQPCVDDFFLPDIPEKLVLTGDMNAREFMMGATKDEGLIAAIPLVKFFDVGRKSKRKLHTLLNSFRCDLPEVRGIVDAILDEYKTWPLTADKDFVKETFSEIVGDYYITAPTHLYARALSARDVKVFVYNFEYQSDNDPWEGVIHGSEMFYLSGAPIIGHANFRYDVDDRTMTRMLITTWANFIKTGVPSLAPDSFRILAHTAHNGVYAKFSKQPGVPSVTLEKRLKPQRMQFWNRRVVKMYQQQLGSVTYLMPRDSGRLDPKSPAWILGCGCIVLLVFLALATACYLRTRKEMAIVLRWKASEIL